MKYYTILFNNGDKLEGKKMKEIINYIYENNIDDRTYKYIYDRINNKKLDYIKDIQIEEEKKNYYERQKENYNPLKRKELYNNTKDQYKNTIRNYYQNNKEDINNKRRTLYNYKKTMDFLYNINTNLFY
jgi:hypothetical protein